MKTNLTKIVLGTLLGLNLSCNSNLIKNNQDEILERANNRTLTRVLINDNYYLLTKNNEGKFNHALQFVEDSLKIYNIKVYNDTIIIGNKPDFILIDNDGDGNYDIGLKYKINNKYDEIKPGLILLNLY